MKLKLVDEYNEKDDLRSQLTFLNNLLELTSIDDVIDRISIESRKEVILERLKELDV